MAAASGLSRSYSFSIPATGHGGIDMCRLSMMLAFIEDPSRAPGSACIQGLGLRFNTPQVQPALPPAP
jgi:hypothetical protein